MKWISVKDEMPPFALYDDCEQYLIWEEYAQFAYCMNNRWISNPNGGIYIHEYHPTHWMPLPEGPR
jgi:hypothetical protein